MTPADKTEVPAWIRDAAEEIHPFAKCLSAEDRDFQATVEVNDHIAEEQDRAAAIIARHAPARTAEGAASNGVALIAAERARQVSQEGWTPGHDDHHTDFELSQAAVCYAEAAHLVGAHPPLSAEDTPDNWPWDYQWWKPSSDPIRNLVKAGALIAAEIDRLRRAAAPSTTEAG